MKFTCTIAEHIYDYEKKVTVPLQNSQSQLLKYIYITIYCAESTVSIYIAIQFL